MNYFKLTLMSFFVMATVVPTTNLTILVPYNTEILEEYEAPFSLTHYDIKQYKEDVDALCLGKTVDEALEVLAYQYNLISKFIGKSDSSNINQWVYSFNEIVRNKEMKLRAILNGAELVKTEIIVLPSGRFLK